MDKFHVGDDGVPRKCVASVQDCRVGGGGEENHYSTPQIAREAYEVKMKNQLDAILQQGRSAAIQEAAGERFSKDVLNGIDRGEYTNPDTGLSFVKGTHPMFKKEEWEWKPEDGESGFGSLKVFFNNENSADVSFYDEDGYTADTVNVSNTVHENDDPLGYRARVLEKASEMVAHHRPEYVKGNEAVLEKMKMYRDHQIEVDGRYMSQISFAAPEVWEVPEYDLPNGVADVNVRVRYGVATGRITYSDGTEKKIQESFETHGSGDGMFPDERFAGKFFAEIEKELKSGHRSEV